MITIMCAVEGNGMDCKAGRASGVACVFMYVVYL